MNDEITSHLVTKSKRPKAKRLPFLDLTQHEVELLIVDENLLRARDVAFISEHSIALTLSVHLAVNGQLTFHFEQQLKFLCRVLYAQC